MRELCGDFLRYLSAILFSFFGIPFCVIGTVVGTYQDWNWAINTDIRMWKRYPKYSNLRWWKVANHSDDNLDYEEQQYRLTQAEKGELKEPGPVSKLIFWTLFYVLLLPFRCIWAGVIGPLEFFERAEFYWKTHIQGRASKDLIAEEVTAILKGDVYV